MDEKTKGLTRQELFQEISQWKSKTLETKRSFIQLKKKAIHLSSVAKKNQKQTELLKQALKTSQECAITSSREIGDLHKEIRSLRANLTEKSEALREAQLKSTQSARALAKSEHSRSQSEQAYQALKNQAISLKVELQEANSQKSGFEQKISGLENSLADIETSNEDLLDELTSTREQLKESLHSHSLRESEYKKTYSYLKSKMEQIGEMKEFQSALQREVQTLKEENHGLSKTLERQNTALRDSKTQQNYSKIKNSALSQQSKRLSHGISDMSRELQKTSTKLQATLEEKALLNDRCSSLESETLNMTKLVTKLNRSNHHLQEQLSHLENMDTKPLPLTTAGPVHPQTECEEQSGSDLYRSAFDALWSFVTEGEDFDFGALALHNNRI